MNECTHLTDVMTLPMVTCPLCCRPGFATSETLCTALVEITTRRLCCPVCNELIYGLDKFTIHLFSHSINKLNTKELVKPQCSINSLLASNCGSKETKQIVKNDVSCCKTNRNLSGGAAGQKSLGPPANPQPSASEKAALTPHNIPPSAQSSLIYFRTDSGQIFALTQDNLKNVTINTQNFITNTNITTSSNSFSNDKFVKERKMIEKNVSEKEVSEIFPKGNESKEASCPLTGTDVTLKKVSKSEPGKGSLSVDIKQKTTQREFESCRDLLMKGDFTTSIDDYLESSVSKGILSDIEKSNTESSESSDKSDFLPDNLLKCEACKFVFPNKTLLAMHIQIVHKKIEIESENKRKLFSCNMCPKTFKMRGSLMVHRRVAHSTGFGSSDGPPKGPPPKPACTVCGKFFKKEVHLTQHMRAHDVKHWQCGICSKTFSTKYFLKKHRRLHTGEMPYKCLKCEKTFTFQQSYNKHMSYHNDDKPYCCSHCGRLFKELSTLQNHERIHSGEKPFSCETCGKAFRQRVSYLVHRRIHTGVMPYKCTACNKNFRYKVSQRSHRCPAQPPGVVVRVQGSLVERLTAAINRAAERVDKKKDKDTGGEGYSISALSPISLTSPSSVTSTLSPAESLCPTPRSLDSGSPATPPKAHFYVLVKGANKESFYRPVSVAPPLLPPRCIQKSKPVKPLDTALLSVHSQQLKPDTPAHSLPHNALKPEDKSSHIKMPPKCKEEEVPKKDPVSKQDERTVSCLSETSSIHDLFENMPDKSSSNLETDSSDAALALPAIGSPIFDPLLDSSDIFQFLNSASKLNITGSYDFSNTWNLSSDSSAEEMQSDPLFDNINDDTLKELLFPFDLN